MFILTDPDHDTRTPPIDTLTQCLAWTAIAAIAYRETVTLHGADLEATFRALLAVERPHAKA